MSAITFSSLTPDSNDSAIILLQKALAAMNAATASIKFNKTVTQAADQSLTANTTLTNSTDLSIPLAANTTYEFEARIQFNEAGTAAGIKLALSGPAAPTTVILNGLCENGTATVTHQSVNAITTVLTPGITTTGLKYATLWGVIVNGANAGNLVFQFAQNTSDANATTLKAGSTLHVRQIS